MSKGLVYVWTPDTTSALGGHVTRQIVRLLRLDEDHGRQRLRGRYAIVRNAGRMNEPVQHNGVRAVDIGNAQPDEDGDFIFEPGRGGGRLDKVVLSPEDMRRRYKLASHFGEVNTYYHLDRIGSYIDQLLQSLGERSLPRVVALVTAHNAATETNGVRDGLRRGDRWVAFQGGHYRLPSKNYEISELEPLSTDGELHLGPGRQLLHYGALVEAIGDRYRSNASHNAGIIYHEYGHHVSRHTADFRANTLRPSNRQSNRKTALDEGFADYWTASMLETPYIWAWHQRHDNEFVHPRSLISKVTMSDFDHRPGADAHRNGTIYAAALWELREQFRSKESNGPRKADLLVLKSLVILGGIDRAGGEKLRNICRIRASYSVALAALLEADRQLYSGLHIDSILETFGRRSIQPDAAEQASERVGGRV